MLVEVLVWTYLFEGRDFSDRVAVVIAVVIVDRMLSKHSIDQGRVNGIVETEK